MKVDLNLINITFINHLVEVLDNSSLHLILKLIFLSIITKNSRLFNTDLKNILSIFTLHLTIIAIFTAFECCILVILIYFRVFQG